MALYSIFIHLTKACDTVNREVLWIILDRYGSPKKFVKIIRLFHDKMMGQRLHGSDTSTSFAITIGVKQGCVLAPFLFNLFFACMLSQAVTDSKEGVYIRYRLNGSLFDLRRLNAKTKCFQGLLFKKPSMQMTVHYWLTTRETYR